MRNETVRDILCQVVHSILLDVMTRSILNGISMQLFLYSPNICHRGYISEWIEKPSLYKQHFNLCDLNHRHFYPGCSTFIKN